MNKLFVLVLLSLFLISLVSAQTTKPVDTSSPFEKVVVKEHFLTKKEIKDYLDLKSLEFQKFSELAINQSFDEIEALINKYINKFIMKFALLIFGVIFFAGSFWYFIKLKLDNKYRQVQALLKIKDKPIFKKDKFENHDKEPVVYTFPNDEPPKPEPTNESDELNELRNKLDEEYEELKDGFQS